MKSLILLLGALIPAVTKAATNVTLYNFAGIATGYPIVDNAGIPIPVEEASWAVGTFEPDFAATLSSLDTTTSDQAVIDAFAQSGSSGTFSFDGLINGSVTDVDRGNANSGKPIYVLVTYSAPGENVQVLVIDIGIDFPAPDGAGGATPNMGRPFNPSDVAYGNPIAVPADPSGLLIAFSGFTEGITFDVVPEPSSAFLSLIAGFGLLTRRRQDESSLFLESFQNSIR